MHMANFFEMEEDRKFYRWHMHIYPRRRKLPVDRAGAEIGFDTDVIDSMLEATAELLRHWYREGPRGELVAKVRGDYTESGLLREFQSSLITVGSWERSS